MRQYLMKDGEEVVKAEIYPALKKRVAEQDPPAVEAELRAMNEYSQHYLHLVRPDAEPDPDIRRHLARLHRWDLTTAHPLLLRLANARRRGKLGKADLCDCLKIIEAFAVRRAVCEVPTNQLKRIFLQLAKTFQETGTAAWLRADLASGLHGARWPKDDEFRSAWQSYRAYNPSRLDRCKLILETLEQDYGHKEPAVLAAATIEHIMPVTLTDEWRAMLGEKAEDVHDLHLHTIGNLTLTGYSSELSNSPFAKKKALLAESHFELNKYFADQPTWGGEPIHARSKALWERARQIWSGPGT